MSALYLLNPFSDYGNEDCHSVPQIQKGVEMFVKSDLRVAEDDSTDRRFFPRPQDIRKVRKVAKIRNQYNQSCSIPDPGYHMGK